MRRPILSRRGAATLVAVVAAGVLSTLAVLSARSVMLGHRADQLADATAQAERLWLMAAEHTAVHGMPMELAPVASNGQSWSIRAVATESPGELRITATVRRGSKIAAVYSEIVQLHTGNPQSDEGATNATDSP